MILSRYTVCRQQADFIRNHENKNIRNVGQREAQNGKTGGLISVVVKAYGPSYN